MSLVHGLIDGNIAVEMFYDCYSSKFAEWRIEQAISINQIA